MRSILIFLFLICSLVSEGQLLINTYIFSDGITNSNGQQAFLIVGDSKFRGSSDGEGPTPSTNTVYEWDETNSQVVAVSTNDLSKASTGSPWPKFGIDYYNYSGKKPVFINMAVAGSAAAVRSGGSTPWTTGSTNYTTAVAEANEAMSVIGVSKLKAILCNLPGINDAAGDATVSAINTASRSLISRLQTDFPGVPIYLMDVGTGSVTYRRDDIDKIIYNDDPDYTFYDGGGYGLGIVQSYSNVYLVYDQTRGFNSSPSKITDSFHWNQTGNDLVGQKLAAFIANGNQLIYTDAPKIIGVDLSSDFSNVKLTFNRRCFKQNLSELDANNFQITFAANGGTATNATISSIEKRNPGSGLSVVKINLSITGSVSGSETIVITPTDVYDKDGNLMTDNTYQIRLSNTDFAAYTFNDLSNTEQWGGTWTTEASAVTGGRVARATSDVGGSKPNLGSKALLRLATVPLNYKEGISIEFDYYFTSASASLGVALKLGSETEFDNQPMSIVFAILYGSEYRLYNTNNANTSQVQFSSSSVAGAPSAINTVERIRVSMISSGNSITITTERNVGGVYTKLHNAYSITTTGGTNRGRGTIGFVDGYVSGTSPIGRFGPPMIKKITALP
jgi:hypothetical protein